MEIEHLKLEIDGLSERTEFNQIQVLRGKGEVPVTISPGNAIVKGGFPSWATITGGDNNYMNGTYTTKETFKYSDNTTEEFDIKHVATKIDFSKYTVPSSNPDYKTELMGQGFYTTCCTCSNHYSIEFTAGTGYSVEQSGQNYIYKIGLEGINDGETLINTIVSALGNNGTPLNHYTSFVKENNTTLVVYDNRGMESKPAKLQGVSGSWQNWRYPQFNVTSGYGYGTFGEGVAYSGKDFEQVRQPIGMRLQIGSEAEDKMDIELPEITSLAMGVNTVDLSTQEGASESIAIFDAAIQYVSSERNRMGAYQNRLEHTVKNLDNAVENTQSAESQIRDMDMAKGMVELSNRNMIAQAAEAMLAQASKMNQGVMSLLQ